MLLFCIFEHDNNIYGNENTLNGVYLFIRYSFIWYACEHKLLLELVKTIRGLIKQQSCGS